MVDIHAHIIPFIDDGPSSYDEALDMLILMKKKGVNKVVATPHYDFGKDDLDEFLSKRNLYLTELKSKCEHRNIDIEVLSGAEIMFTPNLNNYELSNFTVENTDYLLIELSTRREEPFLEATLESIIASGFIPILAHIERYSYLLDNSDRLIKLIEIGVLMQINAKSYFSKKHYSLVHKLIKKKISTLCS